MRSARLRIADGGEAAVRCPLFVIRCIGAEVDFRYHEVKLVGEK
jgi:hypothetical protein